MALWLMFFSVCGERYRILLKTDCGRWAVSYDDPKSPIFVSNESMRQYEKIATPKQYIDNLEISKLKRSRSQDERLSFIKPLIDDEFNIIDRSRRTALAKHIAFKNKTTAKRVLRIYYKYLANQCIIDKRNKKSNLKENYEIYDYAIKKYYYSAKKLSLKTVYDMMLLEKFMDSNGQLMREHPKWDSFRHFFYDNMYNQTTQKNITLWTNVLSKKLPSAIR